MKKILLTLIILCFCSTVWATNYVEDANCQGAWLMTSDGGNETDLSGEDETLTETSGTIPTSSDTPAGYVGTSRDFEIDDTEALVTGDSGSTDISGANQSMSIVAWIKVESSTATYDGIVTKDDDSNGSRQYWLGVDTNNAVFALLSSDGSAINYAIGATALNTGTWYHIAFVYNDTDIRVYLDGSLDSNGASNPAAYINGVFDGTNDFRIGCYGNGGALFSHFDGLVAEVGVFDRALSAEEVKEIKDYGLRGSDNFFHFF